jgi:Flp pilus assembly protein TadG
MVHSTSRLRALCRAFLGNSRGSTSLINMVMAIPLVASAGVAVDYSRASRANSHIQQAVDAAAMAAGAKRTKSSWSNSRKFEEKAAVARAYLAASLSQITDVDLIGEPEISVGPNTVDITVKANVEGTLINIVSALPQADSEVGSGTGGSAVTKSKKRGFGLNVTTKIGYLRDSYLCLLARHPTQREAIYFQGNSEFMANCAVQANSSNSVAIRTWGSAYAQADSFCAVGGWSGSGFSPDPLGGCKSRSDPYASLQLPSASGACNFTNMVVKNTTASLAPGTYCGGLSISTHGVANLEPGIYIIKDGALDVSSNSTLNAPSGVTIYLTGNSAKVDIRSGAVATIVAPNNLTATSATAAYKGMAIIQDRNTGVGATNSISSNGSVNITGAIYTPNQKLVIWANGDMNATSKYFPIIVDTFNMNGNATLYVKLEYNEVNLDDPMVLKTPAKVFVSR